MSSSCRPPLSRELTGGEFRRWFRREDELVQFKHRGDLAYEGIPPEAFFALKLDGDWPTGQVIDHPAFQATGPA